MSTCAELKARHCQDLFARLPEVIAHIGWSQEQLRVVRERRLRELIDTAVTRSTWHRARLSGLDPTTATADTLAGVPTMTKDDLLEHFDDIVTDPRLRRDLVEAHLIDLRASEAGGIAGTCPQGLGLHLNDDLVLVEPVDTHGRPTPVGELSAKVYDNGSWPTR